MGSLSLLQGIFPSQGSNQGLQHCRRILYQLSHQGSPLAVWPWSNYLTSRSCKFLVCKMGSIVEWRVEMTQNETNEQESGWINRVYQTEKTQERWKKDSFRDLCIITRELMFVQSPRKRRERESSRKHQDPLWSTSQNSGNKSKNKRPNQKMGQRTK